MKGTTLNIKLRESDRAARYGVGLGLALYAVWRGLVRFFVPSDLPKRLHGPRRSR